jgi:hypothetical protein
LLPPSALAGHEPSGTLLAEARHQSFEFAQPQCVSSGSLSHPVFNYALQVLQPLEFLVDHRETFLHRRA